MRKACLQDRSHRNEVRLWMLTTVSRLPVDISDDVMSTIVKLSVPSDPQDPTKEAICRQALQLLCEHSPQQVSLHEALSL